MNQPKPRIVLKNFYRAVCTLCFLILLDNARAQTVAFAAKSAPNIEFTFNTMNKYVNGITVPNALTLNIDADLTQWDLYVGAATVTADEWDVTVNYSNVGADPTVNLLEMRLRNGNNTSLISGFFPLTDIAVPTYIIGTGSAPDTPIDCDAPDPTGTNLAGNYINRPSCYRFNVDLRIVPGLGWRPGLYTLRVDFILAPDL